MGKLIVIEGGDGAGKETQAKLAYAALEKGGHAVEYFDFPQYGETLSGAVLRRALRGELVLNGEATDFRRLHPELASLPYTLDRLAAKIRLDLAAAFGIALCNRYTPSNAMYQGAKFSRENEQDSFIAWLEALEYREHKLPAPDLVLYLRVPYDVSHRLARMRGSLDQHEADEEYQRAVGDLYVRTAQRRSESWRVIECVEDGALLAREAIHAEVMREIGIVLCD